MHLGVRWSTHDASNLKIPPRRRPPRIILEQIVGIDRGRFANIQKRFKECLGFAGICNQISVVESQTAA